MFQRLTKSKLPFCFNSNSFSFGYTIISCQLLAFYFFISRMSTYTQKRLNIVTVRSQIYLQKKVSKYLLTSITRALFNIKPLDTNI